MYPENYEDNVKITTYPAVPREPLLTYEHPCKSFWMHVFGYIHLQMTDNQNDDDVHMITAHFSLTWTST